MPTPFFLPTSSSTDGTFAILSLRRDDNIPVILYSDPSSFSTIQTQRQSPHSASAPDSRDPRAASSTTVGYSEGVVTNTQFGSFPHSTLIGVGWGCQVRASKVDTGSRGRRGGEKVDGGAKSRGKRGVKRSRADGEAEAQPQAEAETSSDPVQPTDSISPVPADQTSLGQPSTLTAPITASSGFAYLLPPTPELWTASLPHRTQVLYTPDTSYILSRLCVRPGSVLLEAGAGSGSFTHAAARAVYNGDGGGDERGRGGGGRGRIFSYEFHAQRVEKLRAEIEDHGLDRIVHVEHRDVCEEGFQLGPGHSTPAPLATAVFLDLPSPWLALKHLSRHPPVSSGASPLDPSAATHLCAFSPCIEQVQRTAAELRRLGWTTVEMCEVGQRRVEVRRVIVRAEGRRSGERGVVGSVGSVDEALGRLRKVEERFRSWHGKGRRVKEQEEEEDVQDGREMVDAGEDDGAGPGLGEAEGEGMSPEQEQESELPLYKQGILVHRTEEVVKTHTSYLLFAVLPREWSGEDEQRASLAWPVGSRMVGKPDDQPKELSKRAKKRMARAEREGTDGGVDGFGRS